VTLGIAGVGAVVLAALLWNVDRTGAVVGPLILFSIVGFADLQAAWRLNRALARFAAALPGKPVPSVDCWTGEQGLAWPGLGVRVQGRTVQFRVCDLAVEAGGEAWTVSPSHAAEAGRAAAAKAGIAPRLDPWDGALPGPGPVRTALRTALVLGALAAVLWVISGPPMATFFALLAVGAGAAQAAGVARHRAAMHGFLEGLRAGGVEVAQVDVLEAGVGCRWAVYTSAGLVEVEGAVLLLRVPPLYARAGSLRVKVAVAEGRRAGQNLAERLRS
jgi:hypothetical protein